MADRNQHRFKKWAWPLLAIAAGIVLLAAAVDRFRFWEPGDSSPPAGSDQLSAEEQEEEQQKLGYLLSRPNILPGDAALAVQPAKPGHWTAISQQMQINLGDFVGQSQASVVNQRGTLFPIPDTPYFLRSTRPVTLTKSRPKDIETTLLVPAVDEQMQLALELRERGLGFGIRPTPVPLVSMPSYQYFFVVLAKEPTRYALLKSIDSVVVPYDGATDMDDSTDTMHYQVVLPTIKDSIPLSDNALTWTSTAYILWDEIDPQLFTAAQKQAMVDWLHWGGQLVINGPDSLDLLKGSFLEPYLPATSGGARQITAADLAEFSGQWGIATAGAAGAPLVPQVPWSGITLKPHAEAHAAPGNEGLLVERPVGRGRIVVSAMQLSERELVYWQNGFESWFNACVLRRPPREYGRGYLEELSLHWADPELASRRLDARLTSQLRYFARDVGTETSYHYVDVTEEMANQLGGYNPQTGASSISEYRPPRDAGGIGAWNDFNAPADAARTGLAREAGIDVPNVSFVVVCLAVYLVALVPLNWLVFNALRRLEWAWLAAPVLALVATVLFVQQAQLDIGFVRSQTEIGILELQPEFSRGHLTRYTSLYTSLSATYELEYDELTSLAAPFPAGQEFRLVAGQSRGEVDFERYDKVRLAGLPILSNSASIVHSEQMFALDGAIQLGVSAIDGRTRVENRSELDLHSLGIIHRPVKNEGGADSAEIVGTWIGDLAPSSSAPIALMPFDQAQGKVAFVAEREAEARRTRGEQLDLEPLFRLAYDGTSLEPGEIRLVARVDGILPGVRVSPEASQIRGATIVVAHLKYGPLPPPRPDVNTRAAVTKSNPTGHPTFP